MWGIFAANRTLLWGKPEEIYMPEPKLPCVVYRIMIKIYNQLSFMFVDWCVPHDLYKTFANNKRLPCDKFAKSVVSQSEISMSSSLISQQTWQPITRCLLFENETWYFVQSMVLQCLQSWTKSVSKYKHRKLIRSVQ